MRTLLFAGLAACATSPGGAQVPLSLDTSFRASRITHPPGLSDALPLEDGSVIIAGSFVLDSFVLTQFGWARLLSNGDIDDDFPMGSGGGTIIATDEYYYTVTSGGVKRYSLDGEIDIYYSHSAANNPVPGFIGGNYGDVFVQDDGRVLMTGDMLMPNPFYGQESGWYSLMRINTDATLDSTFDHRQTDGGIWTLEPLANEQFLASGVFTTYEDMPVGRIVRIDADGSLDTTYHSPIRKGYAKCFIHQPNGRLVIGGHFVLENDLDTTHLIRLLPDGALDSTFNNHTEFKRLPYLSFGDFAHSVFDIEPLADGTIIVGGRFTHINGELRRGVALLDSLGNLLNTAFTGQGCGLAHPLNSTQLSSGITAIDPAPDGSIFLSGAFWGFDDGYINDPEQRMIVRLTQVDVGVPDQTSSSPSATAHPNPGNGPVRVEWPAHTIDNWVLRTQDGRTVLRGKVLSDQCSFNATALANGSYVLTIADRDGSATNLKWMKQ